MSEQIAQIVTRIDTLEKTMEKLAESTIDLTKLIVDNARSEEQQKHLIHTINGFGARLEQVEHENAAMRTQIALNNQTSTTLVKWGTHGIWASIAAAASLIVHFLSSKGP